MKELIQRVEDLTCKNHELEWTAISLCRRVHSLSSRIGDKEDRRHHPYLRGRGYGDVLQRQRGRRGEGRARLEGPAVEGSDVVLSDYHSDK